MTATKTYRKRPVLVEAIQLTEDNAADVARWCGGRVEDDVDTDSIRLVVPTLKGRVRAKPGSFVARSTDSGQFAVWSAARFADCFEETSQ